MFASNLFQLSNHVQEICLEPKDAFQLHLSSEIGPLEDGDISKIQDPMVPRILFQQWRILDCLGVLVFQRTYLGAQMELEGVPERDWKAETGLKQKYSLRKKSYFKKDYFPLYFIFLGKVVFNFLALLWRRRVPQLVLELCLYGAHTRYPHAFVFSNAPTVLHTGPG